MASQTQSSDWKPRLAIVEIGQLVFGALEVEPDHNFVRKDWPTTYLAAMHEVIAIEFFVCHIMPLLFPVSDDHGKLNYGAQVGISSLGMFMGSFNVGLAWRYWWLRKASVNILAEPPTLLSRFNKHAATVVALSSNFVLCVWLTDNKVNPTLPAAMPELTLRGIESLIWCFYALILYGAYLGNLLCAQVKFRDIVFAFIYGILAILAVCLESYYVLINEDWSGSELFLSVVLLFWAVCLVLVYSFTPPEQPLVTTISVATQSEVDEIEMSYGLGQYHRNCNCPTFLEWFSFVQLLNSPLDQRVIRPKVFLGATHEVFALTLLMTWGLTLAIPTLREQITDHPAKVIIGSYNPCFGWDYFPASWISVFCCSFNVYLAYRYAWLASLRRTLLRKAGETSWASAVSIFSGYVLGLSANLWLCLWIVGPNPNDPPGRKSDGNHRDPDGPEIFWWSLHTGIFVFMAGAEYFCYVSLLLDIYKSPRSELVNTKMKVFAAVYSYCCVYLVFVYGFNLAFHEPGSGEQALSGSWFLTQLSDILWFLCVISISSFLPDQPPLRQTIAVPEKIGFSPDQDPE